MRVCIIYTGNDKAIVGQFHVYAESPVEYLKSKDFKSPGSLIEAIYMCGTKERGDQALQVSKD